MVSRYLSLILGLILPGAVAWADNLSRHEAVGYQPLAARYEETRRVNGTDEKLDDWYFARQKGQVESARNNYAEVWQRDERGELTLTRVFQQDRKLIQYTPGELRTQRRTKDWTALNSIIDPRQHAALKQVGTGSILGRTALRYIGEIGQERIELLWLAEEALAAKLTRSGANGSSITLELKELRAAPNPNWPLASQAKIDQYAALDGADLGDMEYDPFVKRVLAADGGH